ncbi:MAG: SelB C-terminal domain-containing protein, partial [Cloacibacillus sp.]
ECAKSFDTPDVKFAKELLTLFDRQGALKFTGERARLCGFEPFDEEKFSNQVAAVKNFALAKGFSMPTIDEAREAAALSAEEMKRVVSYLKERKELVTITGAFLLFPEIESEFKNKLQTIEGEITLANVRDVTESSRKYTLPLLEYFDSKGVTRRAGEKRILIKK